MESIAKGGNASCERQMERSLDCLESIHLHDDSAEEAEQLISEFFSECDVKYNEDVRRYITKCCENYRDKCDTLYFDYNHLKKQVILTFYKIS